MFKVEEPQGEELMSLLGGKAYEYLEEKSTKNTDFCDTPDVDNQLFQRRMYRK